MITFEVKRHIEINENYQGFSLTEFSFELNEKVTNDSVVDAFIHSKHFTSESLRDVVKHNPESKPYLRQAFDVEQIKIDDFKKLDKVATTKFLVDFLNEPDWGEDRSEFAKLLDKYLEIQTPLSDEDYYVISIDWFDKGDKRVLEPEDWIYSYYFLIIHTDRKSNTLILTEWSYD